VCVSTPIASFDTSPLSDPANAPCGDSSVTLALRVDQLGQSYRQGFWLRPRPVLAELSLTLPCGGRLALLGPNGSGKSTLLRLLMGLERPSQGAVTVLGGSPRSGGVRRKVGYVPDGTPFPQQVSLLALLSTAARLTGVSGRSARDLARRRLGDFGLASAEQLVLARCSLGMRRRFVLAQCFLVPRELYLLDEPSAGLDVLGQERLAEELQVALERGASLVIASHEGAEWARWAQTLLLLVDGRLRRYCPLSEVLAESAAIEAEWHGEQALERAQLAAAERGLELKHVRPAPALLRRWYREAQKLPGPLRKP
jgi:ABC-type multidrug transport system ATPase subunit